MQITFNGGALWSELQKPSTYKYDECNRCRGVPDAKCKLHLHGPTGWVEGPGTALPLPLSSAAETHTPLLHDCLSAPISTNATPAAEPLVPTWLCFVVYLGFDAMVSTRIMLPCFHQDEFKDRTRYSKIVSASLAMNQVNKICITICCISATPNEADTNPRLVYLKELIKRLPGTLPAFPVSA